MEVGLRVVRGPDWKWGNQDEGEGHVGTVVEIGKPDSSSRDKTVYVRWDSGPRINYRVGYQGAYDLKVFDNAQIGVKHPIVICDACKKHAIAGMRWKCTLCNDYDLCTQCYMSDKHDLSHPFLRIETPTATSVEMPKRRGSKKITAKGIFAGASVVRGPDWDWGTQDGGNNNAGTVVDTRRSDNESGLGTVHIKWKSGSTNVYRLGQKGKVDLKYLKDASGGSYYCDHLPVLGQANGRNQVLSYSSGDVVRIIDDPASVKELQKGHGEWNDAMRGALGKLGKITSIDPDGDLRIKTNGRTWTFNSLCVKPVPSSEAALYEGDDDDEASSTVLALLKSMIVDDKSDSTSQIGEGVSLLSRLLGKQQESTITDKFVVASTEGNMEVVCDILSKFPEMVDQKSQNRTALHVASYKGHPDIVCHLLAAGSNKELQDDDGDTALHYSAFGKQPEVMELLLKKGAAVDAVNKKRCSALHISVQSQNVQCVKVLLKYRCNVNTQDIFGDTALHDAITKDSTEIFELLVNVPDMDFSLKNRRGFNVLHHAAIKRNNSATERLLTRTKQIGLVNEKKEDGFAALHLAAVNGHLEVARTLLVQGQCEVDIRNNCEQTPLMLAVTIGYCSVIELLVTHGASVGAEDQDGDTGLHLVLMKQSTLKGEVYPSEAPMIATALSELSAAGKEKNVAVAIASVLVKKGADLTHKNHEGKTPLDLVADPDIKNFLQCQQTPNGLQRAFFVNSFQQMTSTTEEVEIKKQSDCLICCEVPANVTFEPCGHKVTCVECCLRMKKCVTCQEVILKKTGPAGRLISSKVQQGSSERPENAIQEFEEGQCSICLERKRNVAFLCGHGACATCSQTLEICHLCRKPITNRINLYC